MKDKWNKRLFGCSVVMAVIAAFGMIGAAVKFCFLAPMIPEIAQMPLPDHHGPRQPDHYGLQPENDEDVVIGEGPSPPAPF